VIIKSKVYEPKKDKGFHQDIYCSDEIRSAAATGDLMQVLTVNLRTGDKFKSNALVFETDLNTFDLFFRPEHNASSATKQTEMGIVVIDLNQKDPVPEWIPGVFQLPVTPEL
jgi:hypothetical protein